MCHWNKHGASDAYNFNHQNIFYKPLIKRNVGNTIKKTHLRKKWIREARGLKGPDLGPGCLTVRSKPHITYSWHITDTKYNKHSHFWLQHHCIYRKTDGETCTLKCVFLCSLYFILYTHMIISFIVQKYFSTNVFRKHLVISNNKVFLASLQLGWSCHGISARSLLTSWVADRSFKRRQPVPFQHPTHITHHPKQGQTPTSHTTISRCGMSKSLG